VPFLVVLLAVAITAVIDLWKFKIHNVVTFPVLISGVAYHGWIDGASGVGQSLLGVLFAIAILGAFYCMGGMGAGDVKLLAAIGAWLWLPGTFGVFVASALASGIYAVIVIITCGRFKETWLNLKIIYYRMVAVARHLGAEDHVEIAITKEDRRTRVIPYAAMVAIGLLSLLTAKYIVNP
jgi:prepilin peptidase CpaA